MIQLFWLLIILALTIFSVWSYSDDNLYRFAYSDQEQPVDEPSSAVDIPISQVIHQVPFTSQAPDANWSVFYEEMCEEASLIIAWRYYLGDSGAYLSKQDVNSWLDQVSVWEKNNLGTDVSTDIKAAQITLVEHFQIPESKVIISDLSSVNELKKLLTEGVVVAPFAGRLLGNPNYSGDGPRYHMMTLIGYENNEFIVHDVGTKKGSYYRYNEDILWSALHDYVPLPSDISDGEKRAVLIKK